MTDEPFDRLVEAIAWWRARLPEGRTVLDDAAVQVLIAGDERSIVLELASMYADANAFCVDALVERAIDELDLLSALSPDDETIAARRMCRLVISGELTGRELARWAHLQFHHESESALLNDLALLDDEYDSIQWSDTPTSVLDAQVREIARSVVDLR